MRRLFTIVLLFITVSVYGQQSNTTVTKFTNGLGVPNGVSQKPTTPTTAGYLSYVDGVGLYVWNGSAWVQLATGGSVVTSFNSRTGAVVPLVGDYSSFYWGLTGNQSGTGNKLTTGTLTSSSFINSTSSDSYVLLGGGGTALISSLIPTNYITTNTNQIGLVGSKEWSNGQIIVTGGNGTVGQFNNNSALQPTFWFNNTDVTGILFHGKANNVTTSELKANGNWTATKFITTSGTSSQVVLGDGTLGTYGSGTTTNSLTAGYGLSGTAFNGSAPLTWTADTTSGTGLVSKSRLATNLTGYLPLTAGSGKSLTGTLYNTQNAAGAAVPSAGIILQNTTTSSSYSPPLTTLSTSAGGVVRGNSIRSNVNSFTVYNTSNGTTFFEKLALNGSEISLTQGNSSAANTISIDYSRATSSRLYYLPNNDGALATNPMTTIGDIVYGGTVLNSTATPTRLAAVAVGNALISAGTGTAPTWGDIDLTNTVTGTLPIANGGTGNTSGTATINANLTGMVTSVGNVASLGSFTSANLMTALTDETGTGVAVFGTAPTFTTSIVANNVSAGNITSSVFARNTGATAGTGSALGFQMNGSVTRATISAVLVNSPVTNDTKFQFQTMNNSVMNTVLEISSTGTLTPTGSVLLSTSGVDQWYQGVSSSTARKGLLITNGSTVNMGIYTGGSSTIGAFTESTSLMVYGTGLSGGGGGNEAHLWYSTGKGNMFAMNAATSTNTSYFPLTVTGAVTATSLVLSGAASTPLTVQTDAGGNAISMARSNGANSLIFIGGGNAAGSIFSLGVNGTTSMQVNASGVVTINTLGSGAVQSTAGVLSAVSDSKLKDVRDFYQGKALSALEGLKKPKYWNYNIKSGLGKNAEGVMQFGLLADEVHTVLGEEFAPTQGTYDKDGVFTKALIEGKETYGLSDRALLSLAIQAIQELNAELKLLKNK